MHHIFSHLYYISYIYHVHNQLCMNIFLLKKDHFISIPNQEQLLQNLLDQAKATIESQSVIIDSYGSFLNILTILLALVALASPIFTYIFGIKPSKDAIKGLQENIDEKIKNFIEDSRNKKIMQAVDDIKNNAGLKRKQAINFIAFNIHEHISDIHMFEFYNLAVNGKLIEDELLSICSFLGSRQNKFADVFFNDVKMLKNPKILGLSINYFVECEVFDLDNLFDQLMEKSEEKDDIYISIIFSTLYKSERLLHNILNSEILINKLDKNSKIRIISNFNFLIGSGKITEEALQQTKLYKFAKN